MADASNFVRELSPPRSLPQGWKRWEFAYGEGNVSSGKTYKRWVSPDGKVMNAGLEGCIKFHCDTYGGDLEELLNLIEKPPVVDEESRKARRAAAIGAYRKRHGTLSSSNLPPGWSSTLLEPAPCGQIHKLYHGPEGKRLRLLLDVEAFLGEAYLDDADVTPSAASNRTAISHRPAFRAAVGTTGHSPSLAAAPPDDETTSQQMQRLERENDDLKRDMASLQTQHTVQHETQDRLLQEIVDAKIRSHELEIYLCGLQRKFVLQGRSPPAIPASFKTSAHAPSGCSAPHRKRKFQQSADTAKKLNKSGLSKGSAGLSKKQAASIGAAARRRLAAAKKMKTPLQRKTVVPEPSYPASASSTAFFGQWLRITRPSLKQATIDTYVKAAAQYCQKSKPQRSKANSSAVAAFKEFRKQGVSKGGSAGKTGKFKTSAKVKGGSAGKTGKFKASAKVKAMANVTPKAKATAKSKAGTAGPTAWNQATLQAQIEVPGTSEEAVAMRLRAAKRIYGAMRQKYKGGRSVTP